MSQDKFSYQDLRVYRDLIQFISLAEGVTSKWDRAHAIVDHFGRASEGALVCLAEASRTRRAAARRQNVDYSLGSILECAGCLDVADCKSLCSADLCAELKQKLCLVFRQLVALKRSWQRMEVREDDLRYGDDHIFNHERLKAYQLALKVIRILASGQLLERLPRPEFRRIDEAATSIVLNIAEGNGRFAHLDHSRFLEIASRSTTKLAARIEICALRGGISHVRRDELNQLLVRIDQMTAKLAHTWRNSDG